MGLKHGITFPLVLVLIFLIQNFLCRGRAEYQTENRDTEVQMVTV